MNDDFSDLEVELKRLRPCAPSSELQAHLAAALNRPASAYRPAFPSRAWRWVLGSTAVAAAVALAFVIMHQSEAVKTIPGPTTRSVGKTASEPNTAATAAADLYQPVSAENLLYESRDEGLITLDDGTAAHRVFQRYLDTYTWRNPHTNASLRWTVPRDEVRVVPVRAY